ncbi:hypothetical protein SK128_028062, partial [Halocaridina rubra]
MLPDTWADVTVIGICHLLLLQIPRASLQPLPATTTHTANGSQMSPVLGWFQASLKLGNKSCVPRSRYTRDFPAHLPKIHQKLTRCHEHGITLNKDKFIVAALSVDFCGYTVIRDGIYADK